MMPPGNSISAAGAEAEPYGQLHPRRWLILGLCCLLFVCTQFYRVSNAVIAPELQRDLMVSPEQLGMLNAAFFYFFALMQLPLGLLLDRFGARLTITVLGLTGSVGAWLFAGADGFGGATLGRALLGLGMAANLMGSMKLFTRWFSPREFATLTGVVLALGSLGSMFAATPLAVMVDQLGWRWSFRIIGGLTALVTLLFWWMALDDPPGRAGQAETDDGEPRMTMFQAIKVLMKSRDYWLIAWTGFLRYGSFMAIFSLWVGPYLILGLGMSAVKAGNFLLLANIGFILGGPLGGWLSDRVVRSRKWVVVLGLGGLAAVLLALSQGLGGRHEFVLGALLFLFGLTSPMGMVSFAHIKEVMPPAMTGTAVTGINLFFHLGSAMFLQGMGLVVGQTAARGRPAVGTGGHAYESAFFLGFLAAALGMVLYLFTRDAASPNIGRSSK
jgi:nitrate/nitrite transporter NarK